MGCLPMGFRNSLKSQDDTRPKPASDRVGKTLESEIVGILGDKDEDALAKVQVRTGEQLCQGLNPVELGRTRTYKKLCALFPGMELQNKWCAGTLRTKVGSEMAKAKTPVKARWQSAVGAHLLANDETKPLKINDELNTRFTICQDKGVTAAPE